MTVDGAAAVGHLLDVVAMALDSTLEAVALGGSGDVDMVAGGEHVGLALSADFKLGSGRGDAGERRNIYNNVYYSFISISTPAGRSRPCRASMHFALGLRISINLLWVLRSNCSRESLYL